MWINMNFVYQVCDKNKLYYDAARSTKHQEDKIVPNTDNNFMIFAILHFYNFTLLTDTTLQNNDNEISLHFNP